MKILKLGIKKNGKYSRQIMLSIGKQFVTSFVFLGNQETK